MGNYFGNKKQIENILVLNLSEGQIKLGKTLKKILKNNGKSREEKKSVIFDLNKGNIKNKEINLYELKNFDLITNNKIDFFLNLIHFNSIFIIISFLDIPEIFNKSVLKKIVNTYFTQKNTSFKFFIFNETQPRKKFSFLLKEAKTEEYLEETKKNRQIDKEVEINVKNNLEDEKINKSQIYSKKKKDKQDKNIQDCSLFKKGYFKDFHYVLDYNSLSEEQVYFILEVI